ncbi:TniQ family protein [Photobacterium leiognathi]|uniref:TniQ family protein n=1 Tax=Photobacterium leiognathi TaxID=553611 RepID=UPI0027362DA7|nr:TniQ family protein [Photobacterium leiognathi]
MVKSITFYQDEALESHLLRLSQQLGFESFSDFADEIRSQLKYEHYDIAGAFPVELHRINIYHAHTTSQLRIRGLMLIDRIQQNENSGLLTIALMHSKAEFSSNYKALFRNGVDYPYSFMRSNVVPVCPHCLAEAGYIRHYWHIEPYQVCHIHNCELVNVCDSCHQELNYQLSENIEYCQCGKKLSELVTKPAKQAELKTSRWLVGESVSESGILSKSLDLSARYGFLLWYINRYSAQGDIRLKDFICFAEAWPHAFYEDLDHRVELATQKQTKRWSRTFFHEVFHSLLQDSRHLPNRDLKENPVLHAVLQYLTMLISKFPRTKSGNVGDILMSVLDVSTLLSCTTEEVYRLYECGLLTSTVRRSLHEKLPSHQSVFHLRSVVELKLSRMCSSADGTTIYLSDW